MDRPFCVIVDTRGYSEYEDPEHGFHLEEIGWDCLFLTTEKFLPSFPHRESLRAEAVDYGNPILAPNFAPLKHRVRELAHMRRIDGIAVSLEPLILATAELRAELDIIGARPDEADVLQDKQLMKRLVQNAGIRVAQQFSDPDEIRTQLEAGVELVLKPRRGYGSRDVVFLRSVADLGNGLSAEIMATCLVEERVFGSVFHVDSLVRDRRPARSAVFAYNQPPHKVVAGEARYATSVDAGPLQTRLLEFNAACIAALAPCDTATHLEIFLTPSGELVFGEVGARPGGGHAGLATSSVMGCNAFAAHVALQVGAPLPEPRNSSQAAGWVKILKSPGVPRSIHWPNRELWPWIIAEQRTIAVGEPIARPLYNGDVAASFAVRGDSQFEVVARIQSCVDSFGITFESGAEPPLFAANLDRRVQDPTRISQFMLLLWVTTIASVSAFCYYIYPSLLAFRHISETAIGLVMGVFYLGSFAGMLAMPAMFRLIGGRAALLGGCLILGCSSLVMLLPLELPGIIVLRALQGMAWGMILVSTAVASLTLIGAGRLAQAGAIYGACFLVGQALGPAISELLVRLTQRVEAPLLLSAGAAFLAMASVLTLRKEAFRFERAVTRGVKVRRMAKPIAATFLLSLGFGGATSFIVNYAESRGVYPESSFFLGSLVSGLFLRLYGGRYLDEFSREHVSAVAAVLNLLGLVSVLWLDSSLQMWIAGGFIGASAAIYSGSLQAMAVERSADRVSAVTVFRGAVTLAVAFSSTTGGWLVDASGYNMLFAVLAAASCLAFVLLVWPSTPEEIAEPD